jgi:hypothetical protein
LVTAGAKKLEWLLNAGTLLKSCILEPGLPLGLDKRSGYAILKLFALLTCSESLPGGYCNNRVNHSKLMIRDSFPTWYFRLMGIVWHSQNGYKALLADTASFRIRPAPWLISGVSARPLSRISRENRVASGCGSAALLFTSPLGALNTAKQQVWKLWWASP